MPGWSGSRCGAALRIALHCRESLAVSSALRSTADRRVHLAHGGGRLVGGAGEALHAPGHGLHRAAGVGDPGVTWSTRELRRSTLSATSSIALRFQRGRGTARRRPRNAARSRVAASTASRSRGVSHRRSIRSPRRALAASPPRVADAAGIAGGRLGGAPEFRHRVAQRGHQGRERVGGRPGLRRGGGTVRRSSWRRLQGLGQRSDGARAAASTCSRRARQEQEASPAARRGRDAPPCSPRHRPQPRAEQAAP